MSTSIKRALAIAFIACLCCASLFAGGAGEAIGTLFEIIGSTVVGALGGFAVGGIPGAIIGFIAGAGVSIATNVVETQERAQKEKEAYEEAYNQAYSQYAQAEDLYYQNEYNIEQTGLAAAQTQANISGFDQTLRRWQTQYDIEKQSLQQQAESQYDALMSNWQGTELLAAARGQSGGSADIIAQQRQNQVAQLAGSDLILDQYGGTYGTSLSEFRLDMLAGRNELMENRKIQAQALASYKQSLGQYQILRDQYFSAYEKAYANTASAYEKTDKSKQMLATKPQRTGL